MSAWDRGRGERDERVERPAGHHEEERVLDGLGPAQQDRALPEVVQYERGEGEREPRHPDGPCAEVAHIGVKRLAAGQTEDDRREDEEAPAAGLGEEANPVNRVDGG